MKPSKFGESLGWRFAYFPGTHRLCAMTRLAPSASPGALVSANGECEADRCNGAELSGLIGYRT